MALFETLRRVDVKAVLGSLKAGERATFQLYPREFVFGRWQGGTFTEVRRTGSHYKIGTLPLKTLRQATEFINERLDHYRTPRV